MIDSQCTNALAIYRENDMTWDLEGTRVEAVYLGDIDVSGEVVLSRVAYGGRVKHHVRLEKPFIACGGKIKRDAGAVVIVSHSHVRRVMGLSATPTA